jgi:hypothetical protein
MKRDRLPIRGCLAKLPPTSSGNGQSVAEPVEAASFKTASVVLSTVILLVTVFSGCVGSRTAVVPPAFEGSAVENAMRGAARITEFKGFGEITLSDRGQRSIGKIDAARRNTGYVKAQIYSPFGSAIATINTEDFAGRVSIGKEYFDFSYDDRMEEVSFPCVRRLTYGKFINCLTGSMPDVFWELPIVPDTLIQGKKKRGLTAAWFSDTLTVRAQISPQSGQFETVTFNYDIGGDKLTMRFGKFKKGVPHEIVVRESSKNYISINYEKVVWK